MKFRLGPSASDILVDRASVANHVAPASDGTVVKLASRVRRSLTEVRDFAVKQPQWLIIGILYCWVWYTPMPSGGGQADGPLAWCWQVWSNINLPLGFQLFVPLAVGLLIWSRRASLRTDWRHVVANFPDHHPKREGNLIPLAIGALLLVVAHFVVVKGVGVIAAIVIAIGVTYRLYGKVILRKLAVPFALLWLMIPPPDTFVDSLFVGKTKAIELKVSNALLNIIHVQSINQSAFLVVNGVPLGASPYVYSGFGAAAGAAFLSLVYSLYRRALPLATLWTVLVSTLLVFVVNIFRIILIAITFNQQADIANLLESPFTAWIEIGIAFTLAILAMRVKVGRFDLGRKAPLSVRHALRMAGTGVETIALPLVGVAKVARIMGAGWTWSEQRLERLLKALTPKRRRRRRSSHSGNRRR